MSNALQRFASAVNILPLEEASFSSINHFLSIFSGEVNVEPELHISPDAELVQCSYRADSETILQPMVQYLADCGTADREFANLQRICAKIRKHRRKFAK